MQNNPIKELKKQQHRIYSFDIMRIISAAFVVMIHSASDLINKQIYANVPFTIANLTNSVVRCAVPLFIMISGALMLNESRNITFKKTMKSTLRIVLILAFWSAAYATFYKILIPLKNGAPISLSQFFTFFFASSFHLWFLFMIIGLYLITPLLRLFVKKENLKYVVYLIILCVIVSILPRFIDGTLNLFLEKKNIFTGYVAKFRFGYVNEYLMYYLLGWVITNAPIKKAYRIALYVLGAGSCIFTFVASQFLLDNVKKRTVFYEPYMFNILLYSLAVFVFVYYAFKDVNFDKTGKIITKLSSMTFGVYLVHVFIIIILQKVVKHFVPGTIDSFMIIMPLSVILSFVVSYVILKIPVLKKTITT